MTTDTRTRILEAATTCIARAGVRGLRVNDVADEAEVSPALLYYHFTDRAGLMAATLDFINVAAVAPAEPSGEFAGEPAIDRARRLLLDEIQDAPAVRRNSVAWNELRSSAVFEPEIATALGATTAAWNANIATALGADGADHAERADDDDAAARAEILTALVEGLSGRWLNSTISTDRARHLLAQAFESLSVPRTSSPDQENS
jgi:TetR/AcrR family transcriptional regulator, transcriptional repressor of bet genes